MDKVSIIEKLEAEHIKQLQHLYKQTWWAPNRTMEEILIMLNNSHSFGLIENETKKLIGYARVLTDEIKYAFIFDVIVDEMFHAQGLGKKLMRVIIAHPRFRNIKYFELNCKPDMVKFYEKFGFSEDYDDVKPMRCRIER